MSQFNNLNYLRSDRNLVLESAYSSKTVTSSDKLFHAILENNDTNKANNWVANYDQGLLFRIAGKDINVPTILSLHLVLDSLIRNGEDVNAKGDNGSTPLHQASLKGNLEMVKLLIEHGADMNVKNNYGKTPLHWASFKGHLEITQLLIKHGADLNAKDNNGWTPLHAAANRGNLKMAQLLIEKGADVNAIDKNKDTPLHRASFKGNLEIAQLLKIVDHLDKNDSIDNLNSDIENVTTEQIKDYYNTNKDQIDSLMKHRKESQLVLSIVHTPYNVVLHPNLNEERIITYSLVLMKANRCLRNLPALCPFPVKDNSQWIFIMDGFQFFSLQDLGKLAQVNKQFRDILSLIRQNDGIQILIRLNKYRLNN